MNYIVVTVESGKHQNALYITDMLNRMSAEGWTLHSTASVSENPSCSTLFYHFQRPPKASPAGPEN